MDTRIRTDARIATLLVEALNGTLIEEQAEQLAAIDDGLGKLAWLAAAKRIAELKAKIDGPPKVDPNTPSGQRPIYIKWTWRTTRRSGRRSPRSCGGWCGTAFGCGSGQTLIRCGTAG